MKPGYSDVKFTSHALHLSVKIVARASSARFAVRDEPGRADILLGSSLLWETEQSEEQNDQQEVICFHDVIFMTSK